ncbi:hypothetical protein B0A49_01987 [Cryomyces minteri]|uniref:Uncharacterized protein n=1 Tax=Cryomyces minteri TaxID=331657 RepID=A0A4U0XKM2_9PEZI|nr:hypothetical protein B0A49_01987 [Cryomyces minteri]
MPHKHTRDKTSEATFYNLPPTAIARPLSVRKGPNPSSASAPPIKTKAKRKKSKNGFGDDDTSKAFARLMQLQSTRKGLSGLDNGEPRKNKKRKLGQDEPAKEAANAAPGVPKIQPGERMSDFAARVDQALPVASLARKGGAKDRQTKTEKRLQKMYAEWRKEEARLKDKEEEARELEEEEADEQDALYEDKTVQIPAKGKKASKRKRLVIGEERATGNDDDDDPWAALKATRDQPKGLHDVAQAPPTFKHIPREKFKVRNGARAEVADVPNAAGSLKRREELGETRKGIIESYRRMMEEKRAGGA